MASSDDLLSCAEVAAKLGCPRRTVYGWIYAKKLKPRTRDGKKMVSLSAAAAIQRSSKPGRGAGSKKKRPYANLSDRTMTIAEFAKRAGVQPRTATQWKRDGKIERYDEATADAMAEQRGDRGAHINGKPLSAHTQAKVRKAVAEAEMAEMKVQRERGRLYDANVVDGVVRQLAATARAELQRVAREIPGAAVAEVRAVGPEERADVEARIRGVANRMIRASLERLNELEVQFDDGQDE